MRRRRCCPLLASLTVLAGSRLYSQAPAPPPVQSAAAYTAVLSPLPDELASLAKALVPDASKLQVTHFNGLDFTAAEIGGRRYVFAQTGRSLVNAAMNTQLVLDHFQVGAVYFAGVARAVDPACAPGDVIIPASWAYHGEAAYFNETGPGQFALAGTFQQKYANFGMIFPDNVAVKREGLAEWAPEPSFPADEKLWGDAKKAALPALPVGDRICQVRFGGTGVSGTVFCDNAEYRKWLFDVWKAPGVDQEAAAVAHVCWVNRVPCLLVAGLSDVAGGGSPQAEAQKIASEHAAVVLSAVLHAAP